MADFRWPEEDAEQTRVDAEITRHQRELRLAAGWSPNGPPGDRNVRYILSRAAEERRLAAAGDVTDADSALRWLADHVTVDHEYGG
jgi:hypothetical protein